MLDSCEIFDSLTEPTFVINEQGKVLYCNEPAAIISGLSVRRVTRADSISEIFEFTPAIPEVFLKLSSIQSPTPYKELVFESCAGSKGKVQLTVQPFTAVDNQATWLVYFRDVTLEETLQKKYRAELDQKEGVILELQKAQATLEDYSKNLEKMVEDRTKEIHDLNRTLSALLDSLGQGFFIFDKDGRCLPIFSKACIDMLGESPANRDFWDVLKITDDKKEGVKKWIYTLFAEMLPFEDLTPLAPKDFPNLDDRSIALSYYPIRNDDGSLGHTVVMASDVTAEVEAIQQADYERARSQMILKLVSDHNRTQAFIRESLSLLSDLDGLIQSDFRRIDREHLFRVLHTLKGGSASYALKHIRDICHTAETALTEFIPDSSNAEKRWDRLVELCKEISKAFHDFLEDNRALLGDREQMNQRQITIKKDKVSELLALIPKLTSDSIADWVQNEFLYEPIGPYCADFDSVIQSIAADQGKEIRPVAIHGGDLRVNLEHYERLLGCLIHAMQNAADHGIEPLHERAHASKKPAGEISLSFSRVIDQGSDLLRIQIKDDGRGIDPAKLRGVLQSKGRSVEGLSDHQILQHIFDSGLSTKENVTPVSGRGVGMSAILSACHDLGGTAVVHSVVGQGTTTTIEVPYILDVKSTEKAA